MRCMSLEMYISDDMVNLVIGKDTFYFVEKDGKSGVEQAFDHIKEVLVKSGKWY